MSVELPPLLITPEFLDHMLNADMRTYTDRERRVALRAALGTAASLCDAMGSEIEAQNKRRNHINKNVQTVAGAFRRCGDEIWRMRDRIKP